MGQESSVFFNIIHRKYKWTGMGRKGWRTVGLSDLLAVRRGITALIGSGGKTTAMYLLAEELSHRGTVICTTSTHILPPAHMPVLTAADEVAELLSKQGVVCMGSPGPEGKLIAPPVSAADMADLADYVLVEADGSRQLPCKAHLPHEPVVPPDTDQRILLVGASGFGQPVCRGAHRPDVFCRLSGLEPDDLITPQALAAIICQENLADKVLINQAEAPQALALARELAALLPVPAFAGSLRKRSFLCLL